MREENQKEKMSEDIELIAKDIVDTAIKVHTALGPGCSNLRINIVMHTNYANEGAESLQRYYCQLCMMGNK